jgi:hypothetical protein
VAIGGTAGGTKTVTVSGSGSTYTAAVSGMTTSGTVIATIPAGGASDAAGNPNTASTSTDNTVTFNAPDTTAPSVTINQGATQADPTSTAPINFTVVFSEPVTGFTGNDVAIAGTAGGAKTVTVSGGGSTYTAAVSGMTTSGTVVATIAAGVATDAAGNGNATSTSTDNSVTFNADTTGPTVTIDQAAGQADPTDASPINFTVVFSDAVSGFTAADVTITGTAGGTKTAVVSGGPSMYSVAVSDMASSGTVVATIAAGVATDAAGNGNTASTSTDNTVTFNLPDGTVNRFEETAVSFAGTWSSFSDTLTGVKSSNGTVMGSNVAGSTATLTFTGTGISWIGFPCELCGIANVYLDDLTVPVATVDTFVSPRPSATSVLFSRSGLASGTHTLRIEATGTKNASSGDFFVTVDAFDVSGGSTDGGTPPPPSQDTTAPTVAITSPANGATVSGTIPVTASASDDVEVAGVQFFVDGVATGPEDTTSPYSVAWDTTTTTPGSHTLTAVARDAAGNTATSAPVTVTVSSPPPATTATRFENTDPSVTYTDGADPAAGPVLWWYGSRSRGWSGGTAAFNRANGARATFTFTGTAVSWIGFRAHWAGIANVYIDDEFVAEIDLFEPPNPADRENGEKDQWVVFRATGLTPDEPHTLTVESTGRKHGAVGCNPDPATGGDPTTCASDNAVVVDAFDVEPAGPPPVIGTRFEESSQTTGTWNPAPANQTRIWSGGSAAAASTTACTATTPCTMTFTFTGTEVRWVGLRGPQTGIARVRLDGAFHGDIDTYSLNEVQAVVFTATNLAPGSHTLEIEATGRKNAAASNSSIVVDAFDVRTRFEEADGSIRYTGAWTKDNADKSWSGTTLNTGSGTVAYSATAGAQAELTFSGTSVTWIGYRGPLGGIAEVFVDGVSTGLVDLYSPTEQLRAPVFAWPAESAPLPGPGPHTLRVVVTGQRHASAQNALVLVDAFDVMLPSSVPTFARLQETDPSISYTATTKTTWLQEGRSALRSGESASVSFTPVREPGDPRASGPDAEITLTFTGTGVRWIGDRGRTRGIARVILDGETPIDIDTFAALQDEYQAAIFSATGLELGTHTLTIVVTGTKNPAAGGGLCTTSDGETEQTCDAGTHVVIDAFEIYK